MSYINYKNKCKILFELTLAGIFVGFGFLALLICVLIGLGLSYCERIGCWIIRVIERIKL